mgnify:CR=1 FL=1
MRMYASVGEHVGVCMRGGEHWRSADLSYTHAEAVDRTYWDPTSYRHWDKLRISMELTGYVM